MNVHGIDNYDDLRVSLLKTLEGDIPWAYTDGEGIATFGIGLNLQEHGELVLEALGFDFSGETLQGEALAAEREFGRRLIEAFDRIYTPNSSDENNEAKLTFEAILQERNDYFQSLPPDPSNYTDAAAYESFVASLPVTFTIESAESRESLLTQALDGYTTFHVDGTVFNYPGYENDFDANLTTTGIGTAHPELYTDSRERLALLSLYYNSPSLIGPGLQTALVEDNRAEAWYEIRYNSNGDGTDNIEARRYLESALFGLYDYDPATATEEQLLWRRRVNMALTVSEAAYLEAQALADQGLIAEVGGA